ncbi:hypothetical protein B0H63DRAFT_459481 [Podospora didyma]|uniref:Uncharacterized protein n=1 Tax=Podospora didyma TaxID=330526 RepID=A0AAE0U7Q7_9PEZI|nr:hypothetical protein B0H63DRAFT_459481 [Podospora didyma]
MYLSPPSPIGSTSCAVVPRDEGSSPETTHDAPPTPGWTTPESTTIQTIIFDILATIFALSSLYLAYRQLKAMRQRHHILPRGVWHSSNQTRPAPSRAHRMGLSPLTEKENRRCIY